jgi:hypothetical protein
VVLRLLAALEVRLGPAGLLDQNKMQAQGLASQPHDTWLSLVPPLPRIYQSSLKSAESVNGPRQITSRRIILKS